MTQPENPSSSESEASSSSDGGMSLGDLGSGKHDSTPSLVVPELVRVRFTELAGRLKETAPQGYVEVNVMSQFLELIKEFKPLLKG